MRSKGLFLCGAAILTALAGGVFTSGYQAYAANNVSAAGVMTEDTMAQSATLAVSEDTDSESEDATVTASGDCGKTESDDVKWTLYSDGKLVISGTGEMADSSLGCGCSPWGADVKEVTIGQGVENIGGAAFYECRDLVKVTIPDSVTNIGDYAFCYCDSLESVEIPASVKIIGNSAFQESGLTEVKLPEGLESIGRYAFFGVRHEYGGSDTSIEIPSTVTSIGAYAFAYWFGVASVTIPSSVTSIGARAFQCYGLARVTVPSSVTEMGTGIFTGNTVVQFPENAKCGENATFELDGDTLRINGTGEMTSAPWAGLSAIKKVVIADGITNICDEAFSGCSKLSDITIPDSVTSIGYNAFGLCAGLKGITLPSKLVNIGNGAFYYCKGLTSIELPSGLSSIAQGVFEYCTSLTSVTILNNSVEIYDGDGVFGYSSVTKIIGHAGSTAEAYANKYGYTFVDINKKTEASNSENKDNKTDAENNDTKAENTGSSNTTTIKPETTLATPTVTTSNTAVGVKITWNKISNAAGYIVYRKASGAKNWTQLAKITKNSMVSYTDKNAAAGKTYSYAVKAYKGSVYSNIKTATIVRVKTPSKVTLTPTTKGVKVKWTKTSGAKGYIVYRKAKGAKSWTKVKTITKASTVSFVDTKAKSGKVYYYQVKAYGKSGGKTVYGAAKTSKAIRYLKAPTKVSVAKKRSGIKVTWTKTAGAKGYIVYRKVKGSNKWVRVKTVKSAKTVTYLDRSAKKGKTYTYRVKAYYGSNYSAEKTSKAIKR